MREAAESNREMVAPQRNRSTLAPAKHAARPPMAFPLFAKESHGAQGDARRSALATMALQASESQRLLEDAVRELRELRGMLSRFSPRQSPEHAS